MSLSPREQRILDRIESELGQKDPALAATFARTRLPSSLWQRSPLSTAHTLLLILALVVLIVAHPLALQLGPAGLGILTSALIVPWMVSASRTPTGSAARFRLRFRRRRGQDPMIRTSA